MIKFQKKYTLILTLLCLWFVQSLSAQSLINFARRNSDSLRKLIETVKADTAKINMLNNLSQHFIDNNELASADSAARVAIKLADQLNFKKYKCDSYNKIGTAHLTGNRIDSARFYFLLALNEDKRTSNKHNYIKHLGNIGITYLIQADYQKAMSCYMSSLHFAELFHETSMLSFCYNNIGNFLLQEQRIDESFRYFSDALNANKDLHDKNSFFSSLRNIALFYFQKGDYAKSLSYQHHALHIAKSIGNKFKIKVCYFALADVEVV